MRPPACALGCALSCSFALATLGACSPAASSSALPPNTSLVDPTPLAKCKVAASSAHPLVTEWPASEKAHLQSLVSAQTVAVAYAGCELRIVDGCKLPGSYVWRRTTLASDTVEIADTDELYAKLPIGAVGLEGELARSGRLAVKTTVTGQLRSDGMTERAPAEPACAEATHYISGISVGAFKLLSGSDAAAGGGVSALGAGAGTRASRREVVLREAGVMSSCSATTDESPEARCASPIQLFLTPLSPKSEEPRAEVANDQAAAVHVEFAAPPDSEVWTLRAPGGRIVCQLPCETPVGPVSGYFLSREPRNGYASAVLHLPHSFPHAPGSRVHANYQAERGEPTLSRWTFYLAAPMGVVGAVFTGVGIAQLADPCEEDSSNFNHCNDNPGFFLASGLAWMGIAGAATWWFYWSHEEKVETYDRLPPPAGARSGSSVRVRVGPGVVSGSF